MKVNFGGIVPFSTVDYPGHVASVIFLRGCHVKCDWCQNKHLWDGEDMRELRDVVAGIDASFIDAIVVSGGEPLDQIDAVRELSAWAHEHGLLFGLHTSGEGELDSVLPLTDKVLVSPPGVERFWI